jgi:hypothetical protein
MLVVYAGSGVDPQVHWELVSLQMDIDTKSRLLQEPPNLKDSKPQAKFYQ